MSQHDPLTFHSLQLQNNDGQCASSETKGTSHRCIGKRKRREEKSVSVVINSSVYMLLIPKNMFIV